MNNRININDLNFVNKHIGGKNDDTLQNFNNQINIINNERNDYDRMIDYFNKIEREKNNNNKYIERLDNEQNTTIYRINNFPTYVDDVNFSNPLIYQKDYEPYFNYLNEKNIKPINTQVVKNKYYVNIDSSNRTSTSSFNITNYLSIKDYGLEFTNNSNTLKIYLETPINKTKISLSDFIILRGFKSYTNYYQNLNFFFTNDSQIVVLDINPNFLTRISYLDVTITIEDLQDEHSNYFQNIPYELLNGLKKVFIYIYENTNKLAFELPIKYYTTNQTNNILSSSCKITFNSLGNYPINLINSNIPITSNNLNPYFIVSTIASNYIEVLLTNTISINDNIDLDGYWKNQNFYTGKNIQIGLIDGYIKSFPSANNFSITLNRNYNNIAEIKIISSEIPNIQNNINKNQIFYDSNGINNKSYSNITTNTSTNNINVLNLNNTSNITYTITINNKLYWENIIDKGIYSIELDTGNYTYPLLKQTIEEKVSKIKRNPLHNNNYLYEFNNMEVEFIENINKSIFKMYDIYNVPNCFIEFTNNSTDEKNIFKIKIFLPNHNLKIYDTIFISYALDYYIISEEYINSSMGHKVTNVFDDDFFEITFTNINTITDVGNTKGGYSIQLKKYAIFKLYFNFEDTFGKLMGFRLVGEKYSITDYSNAINNYTITNKEEYYYEINKILIVNNTIPPQNVITDFESQPYTYLLLLLDGLNNNTNPNGPSYFYKFLINKPTNNYLLNTFVNSPVYFNPPIGNLNELNLTLVYPNGGLVNMGNLNYSLTFEITTLNNLPENTNINTNMARI